jgi:glycosyltransferase involved in cell wall biosynthesis
MDWLPKDERVQAHFEKDKGMYDAVNRGLRRSQGQILAYLNCDEQYLPGALHRVSAYFETHPEVDICFADVVVIDPHGNYVCHRGATLPSRLHTLVSRNLAILTCATFFRRSLLDEHGLYFGDRLRDLGDAEWVLRLLQHGVAMGVLHSFTSAFADTGENLCLKPNAQREMTDLYQSAPPLARAARHLIIGQHRLKKLLAGDYHRAPFNYEIYTFASPERRVRFDVRHPRGTWERYQPASKQSH